MINLYSNIWFPVYDEGDSNAGSPPPADPPPADPPPADLQTEGFSQDDVNRILAEDKRKHQTSLKKALDEVTALRSKAQLTADERGDLDTRVEQLQNDLLTKEELAKKTQEKLRFQHEEEKSKLETDRDGWKTRFTESTIIRAITDAAARNNAYNPTQVVSILRTNTRLIEELSQDGSPTGNLIPKVRFQDHDKDGKPVTLELTPSESVKRMKEMDDYLNLFKGEGSGGLGQTTNSGGKKPDAAALARDPAAYREARKAGRLTF